MKKLLLLLMIVPMIGFGQCVSGDCENGYGIRIHSEYKYVGEFKDGYFHGKGVYNWADGAEYIGEYKNGERDGKGTFTYPDGTILEGLFENGVYIE